MASAILQFIQKKTRKKIKVWFVIYFGKYNIVSWQKYEKNGKCFILVVQKKKLKKCSNLNSSVPNLTQAHGACFQVGKEYCAIFYSATVTSRCYVPRGANSFNIKQLETTL